MSFPKLSGSVDVDNKATDPTDLADHPDTVPMLLDNVELVAMRGRLDEFLALQKASDAKITKLLKLVEQLAAFGD